MKTEHTKSLNYIGLIKGSLLYEQQFLLHQLTSHITFLVRKTILVQLVNTVPSFHGNQSPYPSGCLK